MALRLDYVAGVSPSKWLRAWSDRRPDLPLEAARVDEAAQLDGLRSGEVDLAFVRLPIDDEGLHRIPLWEEVAVAVLPKEHPFAEEAELSLADLDGEPIAPVQPDPAMTIELVAAGTGYAIVPHAIARLHHRKDVVAIPVADAPPTRIALVWRTERDDDDIQEFVAVVRGRTARSSRGDEAPTMKPAKAAKLAAAERRAASGAGKGGGSKGGGSKAGTAKSARPSPRTGQGAKQRHRRRGR
ncbi:LysR family substrate-binding domain-containing protein [Agromyces endophyticus]|uniref:LysR family substrate-binding domain-containing protein n=1 Tax=Agromyces sp. H17E-10 TaxID=2932244 RepID=UPI001FCFA592|nr:LysR family substrate-binding domain-containing protein [Agromyces sp. H17E-10]UOQ88208.1 LysR family substrate-binding domain-containing protein [Agromyces sp. H17E-10]